MLCSVLLFSCSKEKESTVPNVPVNLRLDLDDPANFQLNSVGGSMTIIGGNRGIIVYRRGLNEYSAIERTCSYQSTDTCAYVSIDSTISTVGCHCCGSRFQLLDGAPIKGPANASLRLYQTNLINRYLYIYN
ncbi:MAG: Rieske 2Fe-2S domain-containing protein [Sphingobacteriales bacterium]|jgi:nitrite reductase/ring-hydroxylating ferredoxin subunit|nr:Rieske 2Fe-2S domain-containing protein [Sphingobacteriales bacterium]